MVSKCRSGKDVALDEAARTDEIRAPRVTPPQHLDPKSEH